MTAINLFDMLKGEAGQAAMGQLARQFGLEDAQAESALKALLPALSGGLKRNVSQPGGAEALFDALKRGDHEQYLEQPERLAQAETVTDGNAILGHLLGSKDMSRAVASKASARTGLTDGLLKQMLPVVATMAMGALSKQSKNDSMIQKVVMGLLAGQMAKSGGGFLSGLFGGKRKAAQQAAPDNNAMGLINQMLDADGDGNAMDDILQMVMKR